jgi:hypothetical protein
MHILWSEASSALRWALAIAPQPNSKLVWSQSGRLSERNGEIRLRGKANKGCDAFDAFATGQLPLGGFHPMLRDIVPDRTATAGPKTPRQMSNRGVAEIGQFGECWRLARFRQPLVDRAQAPGCESADLHRLAHRHQMTCKLDGELDQDCLDQLAACQAAMTKFLGETEKQSPYGGAGNVEAGFQPTISPIKNLGQPFIDRIVAELTDERRVAAAGAFQAQSLPRWKSDDRSQGAKAMWTPAIHIARPRAGPPGS